MDALDSSIITAALAAATVAKILVDLIRATQKLPPWASPLLALLGAELAAFLLLVAGGATLSAQTAAQTVIAGILAAGTAVGATELQKRGKQDLTAFTAELISLPAETPAAPLATPEPRRDG